MVVSFCFGPMATTLAVPAFHAVLDDPGLTARPVGRRVTRPLLESEARPVPW